MVIPSILQQCRTVAVVGLSPKPHRDSFRVTEYMQGQGWKIIPINPNAREILGEIAYPTLTEAEIAFCCQHIETVLTQACA